MITQLGATVWTGAGLIFSIKSLCIAVVRDPGFHRGVPQIGASCQTLIFMPELLALAAVR
jgi:hypothetical protein